MQPEHDVSGSGRGWVTGAASGAGISAHDVDDGHTTLWTPAFDLTGTSDPHVSYARWYTDRMGGHTEEDTLAVEISSDGGVQWIRLETVTRSEERYRYAQHRVADHVALTDAVRLRFRVSDTGRASVVEAAIDDFRIVDPLPGTRSGRVHALELLPPHPNPFRGSTSVSYVLRAAGEVEVAVYDVAGRQVSVLDAGVRPAGVHRVVWDGRAGSGPAAAGVYVVRLRTGGETTARTLLRVR